MRNIYSLLIAILVFAFGISQSKAQIQVTSFSDLNDVYSLHFDDNGAATDTMWIGTSGGVIYRVSTNYSVAYTLTQQNTGLGSNFITAIAADNYGNKFFGSFDNGVTMYNAGLINIFNSSNSPLNDRILCLAKDNIGNIWAGTPSGAYRFNGSTWDSFNAALEVPGEVRAIAIDGSNIWFGTFGSGLYQYNGSNWTNITTSQGLHSNNVTSLTVRNDSIFAGTQLGLSFYNPIGSSWIQVPTFTNENILTLQKTSSDRIYAGTANGLYYFSFGSWFSYSTSFSPNSINVLELQGFDVWVGFQNEGRGVQRSDGSTPFFYDFTEPGHPGKNDISSIA